MQESMTRAHNSAEDIKKREYANRLYMSGWGVMILGIWGAVRAVMSIYIYRSDIEEFLSDGDGTMEYKAALFAIVTVFVILIYALSLAVHLFIGTRAMAVGRGKKRRPIYLVLAALIIAFSIVPQMATSDEKMYENEADETVFDTEFATDLLDLTLCFACAEMIYCAARIKLLQNKREKTVTKGTEQ